MAVKSNSPTIAGKAQQVEELLTKLYGERPYRRDAYDQDILGALVATILSQHTSDLNSGRAYRILLETFPDGWSSVGSAPVDDVANALRSGGLADVKARRIQRLIADVIQRTGQADLGFLKTWSDHQEVIEFLKSFHGVGPKTAACVAMFNLGHPVIPVDTHVHRVASRIGLIAKGVSADQAHEDLLKLVDPMDAYSFHVHLIEHGRLICHARRPECSNCPVSVCCDYFSGLSVC